MFLNPPALSRCRRAAVCAFGALLAALALAVLAPSSARAATEPLDCLQLVDDQMQQAFADAGWQLIDRAPQPGEDLYSFIELGGAACMWGLPQTDAFTWIAYSRIPDAAASTQQERLAELGYARSEAPEGAFYFWPQPAGSVDEEAWADQGYLFSDGFWYLSASEESLLQIREAVTSLLTVAEDSQAKRAPSPSLIPGLASGEPDAPSSISSLGTLQGLSLSPAQLAATGGLTLVLVAILAFPGKLVESALTENYDALSRKLRPVTAPIMRLVTPLWVRFRMLPRWVALVLGLALATIVSGFIDPAFGANAGSLRMAASIALTLAVESLLVLWLVGVFLRRAQPRLGPRFEFRFGSLLLLLVVVVASRLTGFEPGMLFGVVIALGYAATPDRRTELRASLAEAGLLFGIGIVSWLLYSWAAAVQGPGAHAGAVFVRETWGGLTIGALAALPVLLLPWPGLLGGVIYAWRRLLWLAAYAVSIFAFLVILLPLPDSWAEVSAPLATWVGLYLLFALAALAAWAYLSYGLSWGSGRAAVAEPQNTAEDAFTPSPPS